MSDERTVYATNVLSWINLVYNSPYASWSSARFFNNGPSVVEIGVNYPPRSENRIMISPGEAADYNKEPLRIIYFRAFPGLQASIRVTGEL